MTEAVQQFVLASGGGVIIGLLVAVVTRRALRLTGESLAQIAITLLAPYVAWVLAERAHTSAVLACVAGGLYLRQGFSVAVPPITRLQARAVWHLLVFILNGVIFILIGLALGHIREAGLSGNLATVVWQGALISATAIGVRLVWVPLAIVIPRLVSPALRQRDPIPSWPHILVVAWVGMRGIVSLVAALGLPATTASVRHFPSGTRSSC